MGTKLRARNPFPVQVYLLRAVGVVDDGCYVGATSTHLQYRLAAHIERAYRQRQAVSNAAWIRRILDAGGRIEIDLLETIAAFGDWQEAERRHIAQRKCLPGLINKSPGGYSLSEAAIEALRHANTGKRLSPETREKIAAAHRGRKLSAEHCAKIGARSALRKKTAEECAKIGAALKGRRQAPRAPEHARKLSEAKKAWWALRTAEQRREVCAKMIIARPPKAAVLPEVKIRISDGMKRVWAERSSEERRAVGARLRAAPNSGRPPKP